MSIVTGLKMGKEQEKKAGLFRDKVGTPRIPQHFIVLSPGKTDDVASYVSAADYAEVKYLGVYEGRHAHLFHAVGPSLADSQFHGEAIHINRAWKMPLLRFWLKKNGVPADADGEPVLPKRYVEAR